MKNRSLWIALAALAVGLVSAAAVAVPAMSQDQPAQKQEGKQKDGKKSGKGSWKGKLNLTDAQKDQMTRLKANFKAEKAKAMESGQSQEQIRDQVRSAMMKMKEDMRAILTAEQRAQVDAWKAEKMKRCGGKNKPAAFRA